MAGYQQQIRGKKKMAKINTTTVYVRLLKHVDTFGRKGAIVPISPGQMRNKWFPLRTAEYIPMQELKQLRANDTPMERDFNFGVVLTPSAETTATDTSTPELQDASMFQKRRTDTAALTPERSSQLLEIFVPAHIDFYRQPIIEEKPTTPPPQQPKSPQHPTLAGAAADLMAARSAVPLPSKPTGPQSIYGSVSTHDVLVAIRDAVARNDEAARIALTEADITFVELVEGSEETDATRVKHVGEYQVDITVKGTMVPVRRTVKVIAQEA